MCKTFNHKPLVGWYQQHDDLLCPHHPTPGSVPSRTVWPRLPRGRQTLGPSWGPATHSRPVTQTFQPRSITPRLSALTGKTEDFYCSLYWTNNTETMWSPRVPGSEPTCCTMTMIQPWVDTRTSEVTKGGRCSKFEEKAVSWRKSIYGLPNHRQWDKNNNNTRVLQLVNFAWFGTFH